MKTSYPLPAEPSWFIVDASQATVGRVASKVASVLRGKHKATFVPHLPCGDHVIVINAAQAKFTGTKPEKKQYFRHTGYFGGLKATPVERMLEKKPDEVIRLAIKGMLPKNAMRDKLLKRLHIYADATHTHEPQKPAPLTIS